MKKAEVEALYVERETLEAWINPPPPDPNTWPPVGWSEHPQMPGHLFRVVSSETLREEMFGSPAKSQWLENARFRVSEINKTLQEFFFPKPKDEGTQRKEKFGFAVMLKTGLKRPFDVPALATVVGECQKLADAKKLGINVENMVVDWKPFLKLDPYRELPANIRKELDNAITIKPEKSKFVIVRVGDEDSIDESEEETPEA